MAETKKGSGWMGTENLPREFTDKMKRLLGEEWEEFARCYGKDRYQALRFNLLKKGLEPLQYPKLLGVLGIEKEEHVPWAENACYYGEGAHPGKHPYHEAGLYYIQEPSAMSAAALLAPKPGMRVLDLCAAPGGKSTQLAAALGQQGLLIANEIHPARAKILSQNVERMGICNAIVTNEDSGKLSGLFPGYFHAILVDAPCSGEGMFRKNPEAMEEWSPGQVLLCARRQMEILDNGAKMLLPGGRMVYSTCTFSPEENEAVIEAFLSEHEEFYVEEVNAPWFSPGRPEWIPESNADTWGISCTFRLWPHKLRGEGHFAAVLRKRGELQMPGEGQRELESGKTEQQQKALGGVGRTGGRKKNQMPKGQMLDSVQIADLQEFLGQTLSKEVSRWILEGRFELFKGQLYRLPKDSPSLQGIRVLRAGLHIGEYKKNRFEPSHALALALGLGDVAQAVNLDHRDVRVEAFLRGEALEIATDEKKKGWCLVCVDGFSLGWGKAAGGLLKNHYPKGLRMLGTVKK